MAKITLNDVSSGYNLAEINSNFQEIEDALNNFVLYRNPPDGEPNTLEKDLDVNGKGLLNVGDLTVDGKSLSSFVTDAEASATAAALSETNAAVSEGNAATSETNAAASASIVADWEWKGAWTSSTVYVVNNIVSNSGSTYICTIAHTSSVSFDAGNWELLAQQGAAGAGTGDMVGANNLSELTNTSVARANIGLGNVNNTSDANKPVSTATQTALNAKQATLVSGANIKTVNGTTLLGSGDFVIPSVADHEAAADPHPGYMRRVVSAAVSSTSGVSVDFTSIPAWATRITIVFASLKTSGSSIAVFKVGSSGTPVSSGYVGCTSSVSSGASSGNHTNGARLYSTSWSSSYVSHGRITFTLTNPASNLWEYDGVSSLSNTAASAFFGGSITLAGALDIVRLTTQGGSDTFQTGTLRMIYEG